MKQTFLILVLFGITLLSGCAVPSSFEHLGTTYSDCHISSDYPIQTDQKIITISGIAELEMGSKMDPYAGISVDGFVLFDVETDTISGRHFLSSTGPVFEVVGQKLVVEGYSGGKRTIAGKEFDIFYVTNIKNLDYVCCMPDWPNATEECFWYD